MSAKRSGSRRPGRSLPFPEDCVQALIEDWWVEAQDREVRRGQLLWAHVSFIDWLPYELVPEERREPTQHSRVLFRLEQKRISERPAGPSLPVAALPQNPGEVYAVHRGKMRPILVLGTGGLDVEPALTRGAAKWQSTRTYLVAPYFGVGLSGQRGGWKAELVRRIRHCQYPQYFWDKIPVSGSEESILRLDQMQPVGRHHEAYEYTPYRLSAEALELLDDWLKWFLFQEIERNAALQVARELLFATDETSDRELK